MVAPKAEKSLISLTDSLTTLSIMMTMTNLGAEMEVTEKDSALDGGDDKNDKDEHQEPKHVVHLVPPENKMERKVQKIQTSTKTRYDTHTKR